MKNHLIPVVIAPALILSGCLSSEYPTTLEPSSNLSTFEYIPDRTAATLTVDECHKTISDSLELMVSFGTGFEVFLTASDDELLETVKLLKATAEETSQEFGIASQCIADIADTLYTSSEKQRLYSNVAELNQNGAQIFKRWDESLEELTILIEQQSDEVTQFIANSQIGALMSETSTLNETFLALESTRILRETAKPPGEPLSETEQVVSDLSIEVFADNAELINSMRNMTYGEF